MRALTASIAIALAVSIAVAANDGRQRTRTPPQDRGDATDDDFVTFSRVLPLRLHALQAHA